MEYNILKHTSIALYFVIIYNKGTYQTHYAQYMYVLVNIQIRWLHVLTFLFLFYNFINYIIYELLFTQFKKIKLDNVSIRY